MPLPSPPAQSIKLFIVLFPKTFAWQSLLLRMGTCHGYVLQHVDGSAVLICLGGGGGGGCRFLKEGKNCSMFGCSKCMDN